MNELAESKIWLMRTFFWCSFPLPPLAYILIIYGELFGCKSVLRKISTVHVHVGGSQREEGGPNEVAVEGRPAAGLANQFSKHWRAGPRMQSGGPASSRPAKQCSGGGPGFPPQYATPRSVMRMHETFIKEIGASRREVFW